MKLEGPSLSEPIPTNMEKDVNVKDLVSSRARTRIWVGFDIFFKAFAF